jgi:hypothetical protein
MKVMHSKGSCVGIESSIERKNPKMEMNKEFPKWQSRQRAEKMHTCNT